MNLEIGIAFKVNDEKDVEEHIAYLEEVIKDLRQGYKEGLNWEFKEWVE